MRSSRSLRLLTTKTWTVTKTLGRSSASRQWHRVWGIRSTQVVNGVTEDWYLVVPPVTSEDPRKAFLNVPGDEGGSVDLSPFFTGT